MSNKHSGNLFFSIFQTMIKGERGKEKRDFGSNEHQNHGL
jgi:hypothetical protein